jgi:hypothetical protein
MTDRETLEKAAELRIIRRYEGSLANAVARIAELEMLLERWLYTDSVREFKSLNDDTREALKCPEENK